MRTCIRCGQEKPDSCFYSSGSKRSNRCKSCSIEAVRARRRGLTRRGPRIEFSAQPTKEEASQLLDYDPATGVFLWKATRGRILGGKEAGTVGKKGYRIITMGRRQFKAHRLAWLMVHGVWPADTINHCNGLKGDNRIDNLEDLSRAENSKHAHRTGLMPADQPRRQGRWVRASELNAAREQALRELQR